MDVDFLNLTNIRFYANFTVRKRDDKGLDSRRIETIIASEYLD